MAKRRTRKNTRRNRPKKTLPLGGFPKNKVVKLEYVQELQLTTPSTTGLSKSLPFVANGCYDPYYPIGGHQPKAFDQWMAVYSHFNVLGAKIRVKCVSTGYTHVSWGVCRTPAPTEMNGRTLEYLMENRYQKNARFISGSNNVNIQMNNKALTATYSQKGIYGANATGNANLVGSISANPTDQQYFEVWACPIGADSQSKILDFIVELEYIVLLTEPKVLAQS